MSELIKKRKEERIKQEIERRRGGDKSMNYGKGDLDKESFLVKGGDISNPNEEVARFKGSTLNINDNSRDRLNVTSGEDFRDKIERLRSNKSVPSTSDVADNVTDINSNKKLALRNLAKKIGSGASKGLKMLPLVGPIVGAAMNPGDAAAAIPGLDSAESVGMSPEAEDVMLAETDARMNYNKSDAAKDRIKHLLKLKLKEHTK